MLVLFLLAAILAFGYLLNASSRANHDKAEALRQLDKALSQVQAFKVERDKLIHAAAAAPKGSPKQSQIIGELQQTTAVSPLIGSPGTPGEIGAQGPIGLTGIAGLTGGTGAQGPPGGNGGPGPTGPTGSTGAKGDLGGLGGPGELGPTGLTGTKGDLGPAGPPGPAGTNGQSPASFTFTTADGTTYNCTPSNAHGDYACAAQTPPPPPVAALRR